MAKILSQEEIDALLRASRNPSDKESKAPIATKYVRCNFRQAGQVSKEQIRSVSTLHETFALHVTNSLSAYLRVGMDVNVISVEQIAFSEFLARLPYDLTYLASIDVIPLEATALVQMDLSLAFPVIDLVLGGLGKDEPEERAITEIEENILENVMRIICRELQATWNTVFKVEFRFARREVTQQVSGLMLASEKVLALGFEIRMPENTGLLSVAFPAVVSNALLRKLATQWSQAKPASSDNTERLRDRLRGTLFPVELSLPETPRPAGTAGHRARQDHRPQASRHGAESPAGQRQGLFLAMPVSCGRQRDTQVTGLIPLAADAHRERVEPSPSFPIYRRLPLFRTRGPRPSPTCSKKSRAPSTRPNSWLRNRSSRMRSPPPTRDFASSLRPDHRCGASRPVSFPSRTRTPGVSLMGEAPDGAGELTVDDRDAAAEVSRRVATAGRNRSDGQVERAWSIASDAPRPGTWKRPPQRRFGSRRGRRRSPSSSLPCRTSCWPVSTETAAAAKAPAAASKEPAKSDPAPAAKDPAKTVSICFSISNSKPRIRSRQWRCCPATSSTARRLRDRT